MPPIASQSVTFFVPGVPTPQPRPRVVSHDRYGRRLRRARAISNGPDAAAAKRRIAIIARTAARLRGVEPAEGAVRLTMTAVFPMPARNRHPWAWKATRPDIDNVLKNLLDGLNGVLWHDDGQVAEVTARKVFSANRADVGVLVTVERFHETECEAAAAAAELTAARVAAERTHARCK